MAAASPLHLLSFNAAYLRELCKRNPVTEDHFIRYFMPLIERKLRQYLRSPELVKEGAQETTSRVLVAVGKRDVVRQPERFGAFVHAVCRNVALEICRREKRFVDIEDVQDSIASPFRSPLSMVESGEVRTRVRRVLASLPEFDRQLLEAAFLHEEDRSALCQRFNVNEVYLRVLLHRARKRFMAHMEN